MAYQTENRRNLMLFAGRSHPGLTAEVAAALDVEPVPTHAYEFASGEIFVRFSESVRGCDAFVLQCHSAPVNTWLMEQLIMVDALKRASAKRITVVAPFYPYARQDKKHRGREPISARSAVVRRTVAPAPTVVSVKVHSGPMTAPRATCVRPCRKVLGAIVVSGSRVTSASIQVVRGSTTVVPARTGSCRSTCTPPRFRASSTGRWTISSRCRCSPTTSSPSWTRPR
ncbi:ribose-phosphate diphosphokinase [Frankia sp. KB5]|uniref:ribose-phosphate diphosphokinase n=1 Tax=Frankia sp. KB5 TaxID=683318 RepID=UPI001F52FB33|nr:ribose-phosphate diphosphokinase [Frankia sp. KB5]